MGLDRPKVKRPMGFFRFGAEIRAIMFGEAVARGAEEIPTVFATCADNIIDGKKGGRQPSEEPAGNTVNARKKVRLAAGSR